MCSVAVPDSLNGDGRVGKEVPKVLDSESGLSLDVAVGVEDVETGGVVDDSWLQSGCLSCQSTAKNGKSVEGEHTVRHHDCDVDPTIACSDVFSRAEWRDLFVMDREIGGVVGWEQVSASPADCHGWNAGAPSR